MVVGGVELLQTSLASFPNVPPHLITLKVVLKFYKRILLNVSATTTVTITALLYNIVVCFV